MFIELTRKDGSPLLINQDQIVEISTEGTKGYVGYHVVVSTLKGRWGVRESYDEIKDMLTSNTDIVEILEDANKGVCSNDFYVPIDIDSKLTDKELGDLDKLRAKLFGKIGVPLRYLLKKEDKNNEEAN